MAVPKKRKKLDDDILVSPSASTEEGSISSETPKPRTKKKASPKVSQPKEHKVNEAFDVVDKIGSTATSGTLEVQKFQPQAEQGIHIQFKLDLIRLEDILEIGNPKDQEKENSIVVDFTIPYFWNLPILNEVTKTIVTELKKMKIIQ
ncbi:MAG: hypothetical protein KDK36_15570 [Leptospiraceae bacterium]|nr:hypothetical protein [Leptospiraceae bacterium]